MDKTTATIIGLGILALVFIAFFAVFRKSGKGKIKGPFGTGLEVEGSNEPQQTRIKEVEAGGHIHINETAGRGLDAYKLKAGGDVTIGSLATPKVEAQDNVEERKIVHDLSFKEMKDRIQSTPPFQQADVKQYYVGLTIDWKTRLFSIEKVKSDSLRVVLCVVGADDSFVGVVLCEVPLLKYPELKVFGAFLNQ